MLQIYRKLTVTVSIIAAIVLSLLVSMGAKPAFAAEGENPDLSNCQLLINGQEWIVFGLDTGNPSAGISMDDLNITLQDEDGQLVDPAQYVIEVQQCYWDDDDGKDVMEAAAEPYKVLKDSEKNGKDGFTSYAVTVTPAEGSSYVGQMRADFLVCDKYCLNYVGANNISFDQQYRSNEDYWNRMYSTGYYRLPEGTGEEDLQLMDITQAVIPDGSCTVTYFKRSSGEAIKDIVKNYDMDRQEYINAIWPETDESRLDAFPTKAGSYFVKIEAKEDSAYYGTVIIDFDIEGTFTADLYALASNGHRYSGEEGEVLSIEPGQKIFVVFRTGNEENLEHGLAPLVGFHGCIEENGNITGDLTDAGFKVTNGTVKELGYSGKIQGAEDEDFGIEIDGNNLAPGTTGSLSYCLYPYEGDDFWRDFENGTFSFDADPAEGYVKKLNVVVSDHQWNSGEIIKATPQKDGTIIKRCEICDKTETLQTIPRPVEYTFATAKYTYDGTAKEPAITVTDAEGAAISKDNYSVKYANNKNAGTASATITFKGNYSGSVVRTFTIAKAANPLTIKAKTATVKYSKLKKKNQTLAVSKVIKFTKKLNDKKIYTLSSAKKGSKSFKKYFKINQTTGQVTVKKGLKKGTYKVQVTVKAKGDTNYKASAVQTVTFTIKVK